MESVERLSECLDEVRGAFTTVDQQTALRKVLKLLFRVNHLVTSPPPEISQSTSRVFGVVLQTLLVCGGSPAGTIGGSALSGTSSSSSTSSTSSAASAPNAGAGATTGAAGGGKDPSAFFSDSLVHLLSDCLVKTYDYSAATAINEVIASRLVSPFVKTTLYVVVSRLPANDAKQFLPELLGYTGRHLRGIDYYLKQCMLESVTRVLSNEQTHSSPHFQHEAFRIVTRTFQDKMPEVRIASAKLLRVIARNSSALNAGANSSCTNSNSSNQSSSNSGVMLDSIAQTALKGMDDPAPEARCAFAGVMGIALAKFTAGNNADRRSGNTPIHNPDADSFEDATGGSENRENAPKSATSKLGFKLPNVSLSSLTRKRNCTVTFASIAEVILHLKEMISSRYLNENRNPGSVLAAYSIALCSMFEHLLPESLHPNHFGEIVDSILQILDFPFAFGELACARNAVCFVFRYGINKCLTERQQEELFGVYLYKIKSESTVNHHKVLAMLVECCHLMQSLGESCIGNAKEASILFQALLRHEKQSVRFQASVALASLVAALPYFLQGVIRESVNELRSTASMLLQEAVDFNDSPEGKLSLYVIQGRCGAITHILRSSRLRDENGLSQALLSELLDIAEMLIDSQYRGDYKDSIWLTCTRGGWNLIGALVSCNDEPWIKQTLPRLISMWLKSSVLHTRESSLELMRMEAAVLGLYCFMTHCTELAAKWTGFHTLAAHILHVFLGATQDDFATPVKRRGQVARYRLITWILKCFAVLPGVYQDSYILLMDLIAEYCTAQSLTSLRQTSLVPASSTYLEYALSSADDPLVASSTARVVSTDKPSALFSRELNHMLALSQHTNALTDTEMEVQYLDNFWSACFQKDEKTGSGAPPLGSCFTYVRLVDASVALFGKLFHLVPDDLQLRCLQHYAGVLADGRLYCELNVCSLLFVVLREVKQQVSFASGTNPFTNALWPQQIQSMMLEMLSSEQSRVRRAAGESIGIISSILSESAGKTLVSEIEKRLTADTSVSYSLTSHLHYSTPPDPSILVAAAAYAYACIKRSCGSRVQIDTGLIFRLGGEISQPLRSWVLYAWSIVVESVSPTSEYDQMYVKPTFNLLDAHLLSGFKLSKANKKGLRWNVCTRVAIGRIINGLVSTIGPDLASSSGKERLDDLNTIWELLRCDEDSRVELEFLKFLEQVVVFAPNHCQSRDLLHILQTVSDLAGACSASVGGSIGNHGVIVQWNGLTRNMLQHIALSCIRTLVERDPSHIRQKGIPSVLFHALHTEYSCLTWDYVPLLHGMWDYLSFTASTVCKSKNGLEEIQNTVFALIDIDGGTRSGSQPCSWALFCRSIAIGETSGSSSPPGNSASPRNGTDAAGMENATGSSGMLYENDASSSTLQGATVVAQVETWRRTRIAVGEMLRDLPVLSRRVRLFAVECVLRVFELITSCESSTDYHHHFDLMAARRFHQEKLVTKSISSVAPRDPMVVAHDVATVDHGDASSGNFLCMYLDEFLTLACQVSTALADSHEVQIFQCAGLRLLKVLVQRFGDCRDPEVPDDQARILDTYQAQVLSAIRHALQLTKPATAAPISSAANDRDAGANDNAEQHPHCYPALMLEAHEVVGDAFIAGIIQDRVAAGRVLKMIMSDNLQYSHFIGDEMTRTRLSMTTCTCLARILIAAADAKSDSRALELVDPVTSFLEPFMQNLITCWLNILGDCCLVMQRSENWPALGENDTRTECNKALVLESSNSSSALMDNAVRRLYMESVPIIIHAIFLVRQHLGTTVELSDDAYLFSLQFAKLYLSNLRRTTVDPTALHVLHGVGIVLDSLKKADTNLPSDGVDVLADLIAVLIGLASGKLRMEVVLTLDKLLQRECYASMVQLAKQNGSAREKLHQVVAQAPFCALVILNEIASSSSPEQQITPEHLLELVRFATRGVVFVHTTLADKSQILYALSSVVPICTVFESRQEAQPSVVQCCRAILESFASYVRQDVTPEHHEAVKEVTVRQLRCFAEWLEEIVLQYACQGSVKSCASKVEFALNVASTYVISYPDYLCDSYAAMHCAIADVIHKAISTASTPPAVKAVILRSSYVMLQKLVDSGDNCASQYFTRLGPFLVKTLLDAGSILAAHADQAPLVEEAERFLQQITASLDDDLGNAFVQLVVPQLVSVLMRSQTNAVLSAQISSIVARLLLCFAQTRAFAFKSVIAAMPAENRGILESTLRNALARPTSTSTNNFGTPGGGAGSLDLSRYH